MIRLQKLLAELGLGSRRAVEDWIRAGRLTLNGRTAQLGDRAGAGDDVRLDGRRLELPRDDSAPRQLLLYYKPVGEVTTRHDPEQRPTVFERLPQPAGGRWISVGRLDVNTSGLLLLTTDGALAHRLMHPSGEVPREYLVRVRGRPGPEVLRRLLAGVRLEDGPARFDTLVPAEETPGDGGHASFRVTLHEGRNREVRRLFEAVGFEVSRLLRIRYGPVELPRDMRPGQARFADASLMERLARAGPPERPAAPPGAAPAGPRPALRGGLSRRRPSK
ncbi:MAG TPA: pseudouridine synthase [Steroidobacteraceae bacterium]|jgi:23S rRNA pseudouridine2605 synthase|nr:pseudouridine synthase [Steroidobacteraceae bacterium]